MRIREIIQEMALPTEQIKSMIFYHGTASSISAKNILKNGIQPPDLMVNGKKQNNHLTPVEGKVYITPNLHYALIYAAGGNYVGSDSLKFPYKGNEDKFKYVINNDPNSKHYGRYGFLFKISGNDLKDIQPDEDEIGSFIGLILNNGSTLPYMKPFEQEISKKALQDKYFCDSLINLAKSNISDGTIAKIKQGEMSWMAKAGKSLVKKMPDWMKLKMAEYGFHLAHTGSIVPSECWKFDKTKIGYITEENFFDNAKRIK